MSIWHIRESPTCAKKLWPKGDLSADDLVARSSNLKNRKSIFAVSLFWRHSPTPIPPAQLELLVEDFDEDYFESDGCYFVSEHLRQVMALGPSTVKYFDVDAGRSTPLVRSKKYKIMAPLVVDELSGRPSSAERPNKVTPIGDSASKEIHTQQGVVPSHELFSGKEFSNQILCTDFLAQKIIEAGCTGIRLYDLKHYNRGRKIFRTRHGFEESLGWDADNDVEITKPFEPSDE